MGSHRMSAYNPDGVQKFKTLNTDNFTPEQLKVIEFEFKRHIHAGKDPKDFKIVEILLAFKMAEKENKKKVVDDKNENRSLGEPFERRDLSCIKIPDNQNHSWACIGSTRSGKSYAMKHIWNTYFKKHITLLMTHSGHAEIYRDFKKTVILSDGFHKELIEEPMKLNKLTNDEYKFCCIFDDLGMDGKLSDAMTRGRRAWSAARGAAGRGGRGCSPGSAPRRRGGAGCRGWPAPGCSFRPRSDPPGRCRIRPPAGSSRHPPP